LNSLDLTLLICLQLLGINWDRPHRTPYNPGTHSSVNVEPSWWISPGLIKPIQWGIPAHSSNSPTRPEENYLQTRHTLLKRDQDRAREDVILCLLGLSIYGYIYRLEPVLFCVWVVAGGVICICIWYMPH
jgi:hypothetical protein